MNYKIEIQENKFTKYHFTSEDEESVVQAMITFNQEINDTNLLNEAINDIASCTTHFTELVINHPLYLETNLIDHLICIILDQSYPENIRAQAIYSISPFLEFFNEAQIDSLTDRPLLQNILNLYLYYLDKKDIHMNRIISFLSSLVSSTIQARNEVICQFPIAENYNSIDLKVIDMFNYLKDNIRKEIYAPSHLFFFRCLCYFPLSQDEYGNACAISIKLLEKLPIQDYEDLFKIIWYACKNGFTDVVASMNKYFFPTFQRIDFFKLCTVSALKCLSKILKKMIDCNINLTRLNLKLFCESITKIDFDKSIIILDFIDYLISDDYIIDQSSPSELSISSQANNLAHELRSTYLNLLLEKKNGLFRYLKFIIKSSEDPKLIDFPIKHKIVSTRILKTIIFKCNQYYINEIVRSHFVESILEIVELQDIDIAKHSLSVLLHLMHSCSDIGIIWSVISQIMKINGNQILQNLLDEIKDIKEPIYNEVYQMAVQALEMINSVNEKEITDYGELILESDDDATDFIRDITEDIEQEEEEVREIEADTFHTLESVLDAFLNKDEEIENGYQEDENCDSENDDDDKGDEIEEDDYKYHYEEKDDDDDDDKDSIIEEEDTIADEGFLS